MKRAYVLSSLLLLVLSAGCREDSASILSAKQITSQHELIGGPLAHGQIGDYLIENEHVRFVISGAHHSWGPGLFGGTVVDADLQHRDPRFRGGAGNDHFGELFPTVNLLVADPTATQIEIVSDGSNGSAAQIRIAGSGLMFLEALELLSTTDGSSAELLSNFDVQTAFDFVTTYTLHPGSRALEIETVARRPDQAVPAKVAERCVVSLADCALECGGNYRSVPYDSSEPETTGCLQCACDEGLDMLPFTETAPLLSRILGDTLNLYFEEDAVRPGVIGGDFLFFGGSTKVFVPGPGFDAKGQIFTNLTQGIDTISTPLTFDWIASVGKHVSYAIYTEPPPRPDVCLNRVVLTQLKDPSQREALLDVLVNTYGLASDRAEAAIKHLVYSKLPLPILWQVPEAELAGRVEEATQALGQYATVGTEEDGVCRTTKLLVPLFTSSATMVASSGSSCLKNDASDDASCDEHRTYRFKRYLAVGEGDVSSVTEIIHSAQGTPTGVVKGVVYNQQTGSSEADAEVFAFRDPDPNAPPPSYDELERLNRNQFGTVGLYSQAKADLGLDPRHTGAYRMVLPAGNWLLVARSEAGITGSPVRVNVTASQSETVHLSVHAAAQLELRISDQTGARMPAKVTLQAYDEATGEVAYADGKRRVALGDGRLDDGIFHVIFSPTGTGPQAVEPGRYRIVVSRGPEYSIHEEDRVLTPGQTHVLTAVLRREVDTEGWVSGDFHLHASPSMDSGISLKERIITNIVEGVELLSSSDHDSITDYGPTLMDLGLQSWATTQIGLEVTTLELGHTLGFPLRYNENLQPVHGAIDWVCKTAHEIWQEVRALGEFGPDKTVVVVAHPRDGFLGYFDQFGMDPWTAERGAPGDGLEANNPLFKTLSCDFDAVEILNGKRFELIRTPTVSELNDAILCLEEINNALSHTEVRAACNDLRSPPQCAEEAALQADSAEPCHWYTELSTGINACQDNDPFPVCQDRARNAVTLLTARRTLARTPEEQEAWRNATETQRNPDETLCNPTKIGGYANASAAERLAPCSQHEGVLDDWFTLLNYGLNTTAMGNSDSHGTTSEPGHPRTWIRSSTDAAGRIDREEIAANLQQHQAIASTGPFVEASIHGVPIGGNHRLADGAEVQMALRVQTPSWFGVSRIEIYRNGRLEKVVPVDQPASAIVDYDDVISLGRPEVDSWYVVIAIGLGEEDFLDPVYHTVALGELSLDKITTLAFSSLGLVAGIVGTSSLVPDYFPAIPYAITNPIWVDVDGGGFTAPSGPAPPFCPVACATDSDCPREDDICHANSDIGLAKEGGTCGPDITGTCGLEFATQQSALSRALNQIDPTPPAQPLSHTVGRHLFNAFLHGMH